jgi:hypothetical protein
MDVDSSLSEMDVDSSASDMVVSSSLSKMQDGCGIQRRFYGLDA